MSNMGKLTRLVLPIVRGGKTYTLAIGFRPSPESQWSGAQIVSGIVDSVSHVGGNEYDVRFRRESVTFSFVQGGLEVPYRCTMGGNVVDHPEPLRPYGPFTARAFRGSMASIRAREGDMAWWGPPGAQRAGFVTEARAFDHPPSGGIDWRAESGPSVRYAIHPEPSAFIGQEQPEAGTEVDYDLPDVGAFWDAAVYDWDPGPPTFTPLDRRIFGDDPDVFPVGAALDANEYWVNTRNGALRLSSASSAPAAAAVWFERGWQAWTNASERDAVIVSQGGGYDADGDGNDEMAGAVAPLAAGESMDVILLDNDGDFGDGIVEARIPGVGAAAVRIVGGTITQVLRRTGDSGEMEVVGSPTHSLGSASFFLRVVRDDDFLRFIDVAADEIIATVTLTGAEPEQFAQVAVMTFDGGWLRFLGGGDAEWSRINRGDVEAEVWRRGQRLFPSVPRERRIAVSPKPTRVEGARGAYVEQSARGYRAWRYESGEVVLDAESAPDNITITLPDGSGEPPGDAPGRAPRTLPGQTNCATQGSTNATENVWNWHDVVTLWIADTDDPPTPGTPVSFRRDAFADPRESLTLEYAVRGEDSESAEDWAVVPAGEVLARPHEGVFLLTDDFEAELPEGAQVCFRAAGVLWTRHANLAAQQLNDIADDTETVGSLWSEHQLIAGEGATISGFGGGGHPGPSSVACFGSTQGIIYSDWILGTKRNTLTEYVRRLSEVGRTPPEAIADFSTTGPPGGLVYLFQTGTGAMGAFPFAEFTCGDPPVTHNDQNTYLPTSWATVATWEDYQPSGEGFWSGNFAGSQLLGMILEPDAPPAAGLAAFRFAGPRVVIDPRFQRVPAGTEVLAAWVRARFNSLEHWSFQTTVTATEVRTSPGAVVSYHRTRVNGSTKREWNDSDGFIVNEPFPGPPSTSGGIGFDLIGKRRDTREVEAVAGVWPAVSLRTYPVDAGRWRSYGVGLSGSGTAASGKWRRLRCDALVAGIIAARSDRAVDFQLWPTSSGRDLNATPGSLAGYLRGCLPESGLTVSSVTATEVTWTWTQSGSWFRWESAQFGSVFARLRLPTGEVLDDFPVGHIQRAPVLALPD